MIKRVNNTLLNIAAMLLACCAVIGSISTLAHSGDFADNLEAVSAGGSVDFIVSMTLPLKEGTYTFTREDSAWSCEQLPQFEVDNAKLTDIADSFVQLLCFLDGSSKAGEPTSGEYIDVSVRFTAGDTKCISICKPQDKQLETTAKAAGGSDIYYVPQHFYNEFCHSLTYHAALPELSAMPVGSLRCITLKLDGETYSLSRTLQQTSLPALGQPQLKTVVIWQLQAGEGQPYICAADEPAEFARWYEELRLEGCVCIKADEALIAAYGFDGCCDELAIYCENEDGELVAKRIFLGYKSGDIRFVMLQGSDCIYTISADDIMRICSLFRRAD